MSWVKLDDKFFLHPKVLRISNGAFRLYINGLCYSALYQTDGKLLITCFSSLAESFHDTSVDATNPEKWIAELVEENLWEKHEGHYIIHDFLHYNMPKVEREKLAQLRAKSGQLGGVAKRKQVAKQMLGRVLKHSGSKNVANDGTSQTHTQTPSRTQTHKKEKPPKKEEECGDRTLEASVSTDSPPPEGENTLDPALKAILADCPNLSLVSNGASSGFWDQVLGACEPYPMADSRWLGTKLRVWDQWFESNPSRRSRDRKRLESRLMAWLSRDLEQLARRRV